jgi:hypothetical protein
MKILVFLLLTTIMGVALLSDNTKKKIFAANAENKNSVIGTKNASIDFIIGKWNGTGFVTDANGLQQYIEIQEDNVRLSEYQYQIVGIGKNPVNKFTYSYTKLIYFNKKMNAWFTNGRVQNNILQDSPTVFTENNVFSYSYYDIYSTLIRHTTVRETDDSFTETQEKWGQNGWDKTAWFRMERNFTNKINTVNQ